MPLSTTFKAEACLKRRSGRPFSHSFAFFRTRLFLPDLLEAGEQQVDDYPTTMFVQNDFMDAFFGVHPVALGPNDVAAAAPVCSGPGSRVEPQGEHAREGSPMLLNAPISIGEEGGAHSSDSQSMLVTGPAQLGAAAAPATHMERGMVRVRTSQHEASPRDLRGGRHSTGSPTPSSDSERTLLRPELLLRHNRCGDMRYHPSPIPFQDREQPEAPVPSSPSLTTALSTRSLVWPQNLQGRRGLGPNYVQRAVSESDHRDQDHSLERGSPTWYMARSHNSFSSTSRSSVRSIFVPGDIA